MSRAKYLFVRQDRIGDALISTPLIHALAATHPGAVIDMLLSTNNHFALAGDPVIRRRWVYSGDPFGTPGLLRAIRRERYDFLVDLMDNPSTTSTFLALTAGARWNVGLAKGNDGVYDVLVPLRSRRDTHIIDRLAPLLEPFGVTSVERRIRYHPSPGGPERARELLSGLGISGRYVAVNMSAGSRARFWGVPNLVELCRGMRSARPGLPVLLLHSKGYAEEAGAVAEASGAVPAPQGLSFDMFACLVGGASVLVSPDTAAVHLAAAFGVPVVALYIHADPALRIWDPVGVPCETLETASARLADIPPREVLDAFERLAASTGVLP